MTIRVVIIEDEPLARQTLRGFLSDIDWIDCVGEAGDGASAVQLINAAKPDLALLDIELPEFSGLDVLRKVLHAPNVIFTTAYDQYAVAAFELHAIDYLLKPFGRSRFDLSLERARQAIGAELPDAPLVGRLAEALTPVNPMARLFVRDHGKIIPVLAKDIERLEAEGDYVAVYTSGRRHLVYVSLTEFEQRLDPSQFLRIHRTHIVNVNFVRHLEAYDSGRFLVTMNDGTRLMASRLRSKELRRLTV